MAEKCLLVTGAAGKLGRWLRPRLAKRFGRLRSTDVAAFPAIDGDEETAVVDLADRDAVEKLVAGSWGVVHFGGISREHTFEALMESNFRGTYNVFDAARRHDVERIVFASSAHATGYTPVPQRIDGNAPHRPDTLYGVSKCFGENLARYHVDKFGMDIACLRIGWSIPAPFDDYGRQIWLSYPDLQRLVEACLTAPRFGFAVLYGASDLERGWWHNGHAPSIGYVPGDAAEAQALRSKVARSFGSVPEQRWQGGPFPAMGYRDRSYVHKYDPPPPQVLALIAQGQAEAAKPPARKAGAAKKAAGKSAQPPKKPVKKTAKTASKR
ncbi:MAG: NAD(P)-dependent oxidoreductase [Alphaproteobacteria bacterium]|nr:NAD(P)-dependent oxidoreductase [Alphaproteobacteria bacterium]